LCILLLVIWCLVTAAITKSNSPISVASLFFRGNYARSSTRAIVERHGIERPACWSGGFEEGAAWGAIAARLDRRRRQGGRRVQRRRRAERKNGRAARASEPHRGQGTQVAT